MFVGYIFLKQSPVLFFLVLLFVFFTCSLAGWWAGCRRQAEATQQAADWAEGALLGLLRDTCERHARSLNM